MPQKYTEKHSKALKKHCAPYNSNTDKGFAFELYFSDKVHRRFTPVLISPSFLRSRGLGQVDCCVINRNRLMLYECKYGAAFVGQWQLRRLFVAARFLSLIFERQTYLLKVSGIAKTKGDLYSYKVSSIGVI